jgi:hypothetical protein
MPTITVKREFPPHHADCGDDIRIVGVESFSPHGLTFFIVVTPTWC